MKKLFIVLGLVIGLSASAQPKYVGRFFGDGAGVTNIPLTGLKNYGNIVTNQVPLTAGLPVVGDGGSGVLTTNNLTVATATAQQFLISGVSNKVAVFQSNGVMAGTNTVHISGQFIADTAPGFIGGGSGLTNIPMTGLQGSGGSGTAATNGTAGMRWTSSGNGGGYWSDAGQVFVAQISGPNHTAAVPRYWKASTENNLGNASAIIYNLTGSSGNIKRFNLKIDALGTGTNMVATVTTNGVLTDFTVSLSSIGASTLFGTYTGNTPFTNGTPIGVKLTTDSTSAAATTVFLSWSITCGP